MAEKLLLRSEQFTKKIVPLAVLGGVGMVLSLFCNPQAVKEKLIPGARKILESMSDDADVHDMIGALPDELVPELARTVNDAMRRRVDARGRPLKRSDQSLKKAGTKPHHPLETAVKAVYNSFMHGGKSSG